MRRWIRILDGTVQAPLRLIEPKVPRHSTTSLPATTGAVGDSAYATGRTDRWLKFKCEAGQELVVVGWTDPEGSRVALGALLLAYWDRKDGDDLVYAGKVGTGFSQSVLRDLHARLTGIERDSTPCTRGSSIPRKAVHWAEPRLVAQVALQQQARQPV